MDSDALVQLALQHQNCSQKELAVRLGVSPTQISKWKKGDHMSSEMETKLRALAGLDDQQPSFVLWAGSIEDAEKWDKLIHFLAQLARDSAETGYDTEPLNDDLGLLSWETFHTLREMGVVIPPKFPAELDFDYDDSSNEERWNALEDHPYTSLISNIYRSLNDVYGFYAAYVFELIADDDLELFGTPAEELDSCLLELAAAKIEVNAQMAPNFPAFRRRTMEMYERGLTFLKDKAFRAGIPLRAELLDMVHSPHEELGAEAEHESLGFNSSRLHPDIYMNELLCGMRTIHQVLPVIMKKLEIYDDFELDRSELRLK